MSLNSINTRLALIERDADKVIHIHFKEAAKLDVKGFAEILAARKELAGSEPACVLCFVPDDIDFDIHIMSVDHYAGTDAATFTKAFAIITRASLYTRLFGLYAIYFKLDFPVKVFADEASAMEWLRTF